jgi:hypothetical protein
MEVYMSIRKFPRISTDLSAIVVTNNGAKEVYPIKIAQLSQGGAVLEGDMLLGLGRAVTLEGEFSWGDLKVLCRVLHEYLQGDKFYVGVRFSHGDDGPPQCLKGYINDNLPESVRGLMEPV